MKQIIKQIISAIVSITLLVACAPASTPAATAEFTLTIESPSTSTITPTDIPPSTSTPETKNNIFDESTSPDGSWSAITSLTTTETSRDLLFVVSDSSTDQEWIIEQTNLNELQTPRPGILYPYVFHWTQDGNFMYYSYLSTFTDGCFSYFKPGGFGLKRLDLSSGKSEVIRDGKATWMTFSPDEKNLAYIDTFGGNVSVFEMGANKEHTYPVPQIDTLGMISDTSYIYWSPDNKSLIYTYIVGACDLLVPYHYIIQLFPESNQQTILVDRDEHGFIPVEWNIQDKILLEDNENNNWLLNPNTKEITPANP